MEQQNLSIENFNYNLPTNQIADFPKDIRSSSKLLEYNDGEIQEDIFYHLPQYLPPGTTLVLNNTKVIEARIIFQKPSGGKIEIFCLEPYHVEKMSIALNRSAMVVWRCLIGGASKWKTGTPLNKKLFINEEPVELTAAYEGKQTDHFLIKFTWSPGHFAFSAILHAAGLIPLPPYIKRKVTSEDSYRYQTVFGSTQGSVAAPTAALHFTQEVIRDLALKKVACEYLTLHVGAGTFQPVKEKKVSAHQMHQEQFSLKRQVLVSITKATRIVAVGTTSLRTLESLYWLGVKFLQNNMHEDSTLGQWEAYELDKKVPHITATESLSAVIEWMDARGLDEIHCSTSLMIIPGYKFRIPVGLITNFHQPQSTLLLLVAAFIGEDWRKVYRYALEHAFRFLSYGDSSLLWKKDDEK